MTERGTASLELALGIAVLIVPAVVVVVSFSQWLEARLFVAAAAAEGARGAVLAEVDPSSAAGAIVAELAEGHGLDSAAVRVVMCGGATCEIERGAFVVVTVATEVPVVRTPWGEIGGLTVAATHSEPVDAYRSLP